MEFLDQRFLEAKQRFYLILFGREKQPPRWQFCVSQVNSNMGMAVGSLFVKRYFDQSSRRDTIEMTKELEEAFKLTLSENFWLDNNTKEYARMKLDFMDLKIGFPDFILNEQELDAKYHDVQIHPDYFFENVITILRHVTKVEQKRMGTSVNRTFWSTPPAVVNAYYSRNKNQIMFPAGENKNTYSIKLLIYIGRLGCIKYSHFYIMCRKVLNGLNNEVQWVKSTTK